MNDQEAFDKVAAHLLQQNKRSTMEDDSWCMYRSEEGLMCAVGCLIDDSDYKPEMEKKGIDTLLRAGLMPKSLMSVDSNLLVSLQSMHDEEEPFRWRDELKDIAEIYGLSPAILDTL
jgi:hypothetical protein